MGIELVEDRCQESPTKAHHWLELDYGVWRCRHCYHVKWMPMTWSIGVVFTVAIDRYGLKKAYQLMVRSRPKTAMFLAGMEEIRLLRRTLKGKNLTLAIASIFADLKENLAAITEEVEENKVEEGRLIRQSGIKLRKSSDWHDVATIWM